MAMTHPQTVGESNKSKANLGQHAKRRLDDSSPQSQDQMKRGLFLNVVIGERASILELFAGEDETLLIGRNAFFVLDLGFDVFDAVAGLHFQRDRLARQRLHENLHLDVLGCCGDTELESKLRG